MPLGRVACFASSAFNANCKGSRSIAKGASESKNFSNAAFTAPFKLSLLIQAETSMVALSTTNPKLRRMVGIVGVVVSVLVVVTVTDVLVFVIVEVSVVVVCVVVVTVTVLLVLVLVYGSRKMYNNRKNV